MPSTIFNIIAGSRSRNRACQIISMFYNSVFLNTYMIKKRVIVLRVLPCVQCNSYRRCDSFKSHSTSLRSKVGALLLKHKNNSVCTFGIQVSEENIEFKVKRIIQTYLGALPYAASLPHFIAG